MWYERSKHAPSVTCSPELHGEIERDLRARDRGTLAFGGAAFLEIWAALEGGDAAAVGEVATSALLGVIVLTVINLGLVAATVGGNTAASLSSLAATATRMGEGELDVELHTRRRDEIGDLYDSFDEMRTSLRESLEETEAAKREAERERERAEAAREEAEAAREDAERERERLAEVNAALEADAERFGEVMARCADGDLAQRLETEGETEAMESIADSFNEMMDGIESLVGRIQGFATDVSDASRDVRSNAETVMDASEDVSETIAEISQGADTQTEKIQEIATEMDDISATTEQMAASAAEVAKTSHEAARASENGLRDVRRRAATGSRERSRGRDRALAGVRSGTRGARASERCRRRLVRRPGGAVDAAPARRGAGRIRDAGAPAAESDLRDDLSRARVDGPRVTVGGVDMLDGLPVLDLKVPLESESAFEFESEPD